MLGHDIIVVGASAGGVQTIQELVGQLPKDLPASLFVVVHTSPSSLGVFPQILNRRNSLTASYPKDHEPIETGRIYIAPPDHHLLVKPGFLRVTRGPRENGFRPAVDPLFRTAALAYGARVVAIILSGGLDDGTLGMIDVKQHSGTTIVQDPEEAAFSGMPQSAIENCQVDHVLKVAQIPEVIVRLAHEPVPEGVVAMSRDKHVRRDPAEMGTDALARDELPGSPSAFTCPECGGALWELSGDKVLRFRCHVGHAYTADALLADQGNGVEAALWGALRALDENTALRRRMADRATQRNLLAVAAQYFKQADESELRAAALRKVLLAEPGEKPPRTNGRGKRRRKSNRPNGVHRARRKTATS